MRLRYTPGCLNKTKPSKKQRHTKVPPPNEYPCLTTCKTALPRMKKPKNTTANRLVERKQLLSKTENLQPQVSAPALQHNHRKKRPSSRNRADPSFRQQPKNNLQDRTAVSRKQLPTLLTTVISSSNREGSTPTHRTKHAGTLSLPNIHLQDNTLISSTILPCNDFNEFV